MLITFMCRHDSISRVASSVLSSVMTVQVVAVRVLCPITTFLRSVGDPYCSLDLLTGLWVLWPEVWCSEFMLVVDHRLSSLVYMCD